MITLASVVAMNNALNDIQWWTFGVLISTIPFNIIVGFAFVV